MIVKLRTHRRTRQRLSNRADASTETSRFYSNGEDEMNFWLDELIEVSIIANDEYEENLNKLQ